LFHDLVDTALDDDELEVLKAILSRRRIIGREILFGVYGCGRRKVFLILKGRFQAAQAFFVA